MNRALYAVPILVVVLAAGCTSSKKHAADATGAPSGSAASSAPASSAPASSPASSPAGSSPASSGPASSVPASASSTPTPSPSSTVIPTIAPSVALSTYTKIVNPAVAAMATVDHTLSTLSASSSGPDVAKITFPIAGQITAAYKALGNAVWPAEAAANIRGVMVTFEAVAADLQGVGGSSTFSLSDFQPKFDADVAAANKELALAKAELGG
jgi:hypothetical protein